MLTLTQRRTAEPLSQTRLSSLSGVQYLVVKKVFQVHGAEGPPINPKQTTFRYWYPKKKKIYIYIYIYVCVCICFVWVLQYEYFLILMFFSHSMNFHVFTEIASCTWQHFGGFNGASQLTLPVSWVGWATPYIRDGFPSFNRESLQLVSKTLLLHWWPSCIPMRMWAWTPARIQKPFSTVAV